MSPSSFSDEEAPSQRCITSRTHRPLWAGLAFGAGWPVFTVAITLGTYNALSDDPPTVVLWGFVASWFAPLIIAICIGASTIAFRRNMIWRLVLGWVVSIVLSAGLVLLEWTVACQGSTNGYFC